jgi:hypothetical protein
MLCTKQKVLRRFWYATVPVDTLADGPKPFPGREHRDVPRQCGEAGGAR